MTRSPAELEPEIEASRQALASDVAALRERATPRRMLGDVVERARIQGRRTGRRVLRTASSDPVWLSVIGGVILAGGGAYLLNRLLASRREAARTPAARLSRAVEPIGAVLAGAAAWLVARRRWEDRRDAVTAIAARAARPIRPVWRRITPRKQGIRGLLTFH